MGDVVYLNQYRKERERLRKERRTAENRRRFGTSRGDRAEPRHSEERRNKDLDGKRLEHGRSADDPPSAS